MKNVLGKSSPNRARSRLKGMAVPLRARELTEGARRLQTAGLAGDGATCQIVGPAVLAALGRAQAAILDYLSS